MSPVKHLNHEQEEYDDRYRRMKSEAGRKFRILIALLLGIGLIFSCVMVMINSTP